MKASAKLIAGASAMLGLVLLLGTSATVLSTRSGKEFDHAINVAGKRRQLASEIVTDATEMASLERGIVLRAVLQQASLVERYKQDFSATGESMRRALAQMDSLLDNDGSRRNLAVLRQQFESLVQAHEEMLRYLSGQQFDQVQRVSDEKVLPRAAEIVNQAKTSLRQEDREMEDAAASAASEASINFWSILCLVSLAGLVGVVVLASVRHITVRLRKLSSEMAEGAGQVTSAAAQVSSASESLAHGASEQAASLEETSASIEEITSMTRQNSEHAQQVAELMRQAEQTVGRANQALDVMVRSMGEISESSSKISKIIKVIDEIAFQTNILALNAAVEAARAGEAGMGFAVVADEVRNLAQRSAQAAKDTAVLIEESIERAHEGTKKLDDVREAMRGTTENSLQVKALVEQVNVGSQEQAQGMGQISKAVAQMEKVTQETAANAEESASASGEMKAQAQAIWGVVEALQELVGTEDKRSLAGRGPAPSRPASRPKASLRALEKAVARQRTQPAAVAAGSFDEF
ncbi:MAG: methyl-accepting chemotaxis protein [Acidobacteria bacterium]|nr:methyl-accepting chemotaxis protein [Acidobacteriota bacterium]